MENFFNNPGLNHIGGLIFEQLDHESLEFCSKVCLDWKNMLDNPKFWLKICLKKATKCSTDDEKIKSKILINQWKDLILETENQPNDVTNLLKSMHCKLKFQESIIRPPIYMALLDKNLPLIRHLLWTYR